MHFSFLDVWWGGISVSRARGCCQPWAEGTTAELSPSHSPQSSRVLVQNSWNSFSFLLYSRVVSFGFFFFFFQLGIQLAAVFLQKVQELAGVGGVQPFCAPPRCWGKSHSSFFLAAECLFLCILQLAGTSSPRFLFTCLVISLVSGLLN